MLSAALHTLQIENMSLPSRDAMDTEPTFCRRSFQTEDKLPVDDVTQLHCVHMVLMSIQIYRVENLVPWKHFQTVADCL